MTATPHWQEKRAKTPAMTVRNRRFGRGLRRERGIDPVVASWFGALSCSFPRAEVMFIEAVRAFRDEVPPKLAEEIRDFIKQEVNHSREHLAFNRAFEEIGYDLSAIDARVAQSVADTQAQAPIFQLSITCALEHFTAILANLFLREPEEFATTGIGDPQLWLWHAVEEIEHKGVAFDTWQHATREWSSFQRYRARVMIMLAVTVRFLRNRTADSLDLLEQDGITGWRARWQLLAYLVFKPGMLRKVFGAWLSWFKPGFHPWHHDDSYLIAEWDNQQTLPERSKAGSKGGPATT
ncbi:metal-dependent hydrolase [Aurantiacibacter sediminis]|uniref:Metal-dependent hydrolase n=1 Tax=Aurantiacibacter sediminis TaxID=2793064 RepID=A0ABS0N2C2_9SPHN|nr:metal-dependent hydrolase [Aurantiacibacter sediminis]MBH5322097.1 metal-dependent hydrolase [Aurantiacibacter sediminis]